MIHERHKLIREKDKAVSENNYLVAHEFQLRIDVLAAEADSLRSSMAKGELGNYPGNTQPQSQPSHEETNEAPKPSDYLPGALEIAYMAFFEHLQRNPTHSASAQQFYESFVTKSIVVSLRIPLTFELTF